MYNKYRAQQRYEKRHQKRQEKLNKHKVSVGSLEDIFTYSRLFQGGSKCQSNVKWKASTQAFHRFQCYHTYRNFHRVRLLDDYLPLPNLKFELCERGKVRKICAPRIEDRQIHKVICEDVYPKLYHSRMIDNNPASLPGKGLRYFQNKIKSMLKHHYNKYGMSGDIIIADVHDFFGSSRYDIIKSYHTKLIADDNLHKLVDIITKPECGDVGQNIGYEPAQHEMVYYTTPVDTYMNCQLQLGNYGHYMDDFIICVPPHQDSHEILQIFKDKLGEIGLKLNENKTNIIKFGKPFRICKTKFILIDTGKVVIKGSSLTIKRARHKIKAAKDKIYNDTMTYEDLYNIVQNAIAYYEQYDDHTKVLKLNRLVYATYNIEDAKCIQIYRDLDSLDQAA